MCSNIMEEGGIRGTNTNSQMTELPTLSSNPQAAPVYPITMILWERRGPSHPCLLSGRSLNLENQEVFQGDHWSWAK